MADAIGECVIFFMICPDENIMMRRVRTSAHYGMPFVLEQCRRCGGLWFDDAELHQVRRGEAERIELVDTVALQKASPIQNKTLRCSKDRVQLLRFKDPNFPPDLVIERCPVCRGFWLKRGEFLKYQAHSRGQDDAAHIRKKSQDNFAFEKQIERLLAAHRGNRYDMLGKLARFLSAPIDSATLRPLESRARSSREDRAFNLALDVAALILNLLFRR